MKTGIAILEQEMFSLLRPGEEVMTAPRKDLHRLRAELADMKRAGIIVDAYNWTERGDQVGAIVLWQGSARRPTRKLWPYALAVGAPLLAAGATWLLWLALPFLAMGAAAVTSLAAALVILHFVFGRSVGCSCVIHGRSCR